MHKLEQSLWTTIIIGSAILVYVFMTDICHWLDPVLFPGIGRIWFALIAALPELSKDLLGSMCLLLPGYLAAVGVGIGVGLVVGWSVPVRQILSPIFHGLSPIPPTLYIPYAIAVLPTFWTASFFIIFIGAFWPVLLGTIRGVVLLEERYLDNARMMRLRGWQLLRRVVFPAALPFILNGAGMALVFSFILLVVAEMFGTTSGLGYYIMRSADFSEYQQVLAGIIFMSVVIVLLMTGFDAIQRKALHWHAKR
jgi:NitT/TauT family transport system permease protein